MTNKIEKTHAKEKKIIRTRQYLHGSAICLRSRSCRNFTIIREKNTKCGSIVFFSLKNYIKKTLITKTTVSISCAQDSQWATAWAYWLKPSLHGLSLRKSPMKNHTTSFRVGSLFGSNTTRLHKAQHTCVYYNCVLLVSCF